MNHMTTSKTPDLSTVKGRLLAYLRHSRISQSEFARRLGVTPTYIGAMRKSIPEEKVMKIISLFPDLNRDWLLYGEGEMLIGTGNEEEDNDVKGMYEVPLLPVEAAAGRLQDWSTSVALRQCQMVMSPLPGVDFAIRISGDSMEPNFQDGSTLLIKRINDRAFIPWGHPMVIDTENGVLVKVVYPCRSRHERDDDDDYAAGGSDSEQYVEARSYNRNYPPIKIPTSSIYGLYRVLGSMQLYSTM